MTDLEGVAGVIDWDDYGSPGARCYELACRLTTLETNAAIEGFLAAGATDFLVCDGHGHGAIDQTLLHPAAKLLAGRPLGYPFGMDESFAAACQIGQHAKSSTPGGHLSHTGSFAVDDLTINGRSVGEMGCNMLIAGYYGVPSILVAGDLAAAREAEDLVTGIETAAVKEGVDRGPADGLTGPENRLFNRAAIHLSPEAARKTIREAAERALQRLDEFEPLRFEPPYELVSTLRPEVSGGPLRTAWCASDDLLKLLKLPRRYEG